MTLPRPIGSSLAIAIIVSAPAGAKALPPQWWWTEDPAVKR